MKLSIAVTSIAALAFPHKVAAEFAVCNPSLPCGLSGSVEPLSCPCATGSSVPSIGKSGKSTSVSLSGTCGYEINGGDDYLLCCGTRDYLPCWLMLTGYVMEFFNDWIWPYAAWTCEYGTCCGFNVLADGDYFWPPCASSIVNGKSGKATTLPPPTLTCGNFDGDDGPNPECCGFGNYPPCGECGFLWFPPCESNGVSGTGYTLAGGISPLAGAIKPLGSYSGGSNPHFSGSFPGKRPASGEPASTSTLSMEQLSAEVDGAVEEAVEKMVNIGELNVYESSVNVYKYGDDGEGDVVNVVCKRGAQLNQSFSFRRVRIIFV